MCCRVERLLRLGTAPDLNEATRALDGHDDGRGRWHAHGPGPIGRLCRDDTGRKAVRRQTRARVVGHGAVAAVRGLEQAVQIRLQCLGQSRRHRELRPERALRVVDDVALGGLGGRVGLADGHAAVVARRRERCGFLLADAYQRVLQGAVEGDVVGGIRVLALPALELFLGQRGDGLHAVRGLARERQHARVLLAVVELPAELDAGALVLRVERVCAVAARQNSRVAPLLCRPSIRRDRDDAREEREVGGFPGIILERTQLQQPLHHQVLGIVAVARPQRYLASLGVVAVDVAQQPLQRGRVSRTGRSSAHVVRCYTAACILSTSGQPSAAWGSCTRLSIKPVPHGAKKCGFAGRLKVSSRPDKRSLTGARSEQTTYDLLRSVLKRSEESFAAATQWEGLATACPLCAKPHRRAKARAARHRKV